MTDTSHSIYENPLAGRYASKQMLEVFSDQRKFSTWRRLWLELARAEKSLGLPVSDEQLEEMSSHLDDIDFGAAAEYEKRFRHDVMAHIHAFGDLCPSARGVIHLGATSAYVGDNTDIVIVRDALAILKARLLDLMRNLAAFARSNRDIPTLGFTHFQPAQLTTVGKRACLWLQDIVLDYHDLEHITQTLRFRGVKGTTGTQASFLELLNGDHERVRKLDEMVSAAFGFERRFTVTGQTYTRKMDSRVASVLSGIAQSCAKMSNDIRLLAHLKEVEEPFEASQVGSSAMPYKRNPMRSERIAALARFVVSMESSPANTVMTQWFERTLDDSANKRLSLPQMFLAVDAILLIATNITSGLVVNPAVIRRHVMEELPFIASENIMMEAVKRGGDRQELHEEIRRLSQEAGRRVKQEGRRNELLDLIAGSGRFHLSSGDLNEVLNPSRYIGRAPEQVDEFLAEEVDVLLSAAGGSGTVHVELDV